MVEVVGPVRGSLLSPSFGRHHSVVTEVVRDLTLVVCDDRIPPVRGPGVGNGHRIGRGVGTHRWMHIVDGSTHVVLSITLSVKSSQTKNVGLDFDLTPPSLPLCLHFLPAESRFGVTFKALFSASKKKLTLALTDQFKLICRRQERGTLTNGRPSHTSFFPASRIVTFPSAPLCRDVSFQESKESKNDQTWIQAT